MKKRRVPMQQPLHGENKIFASGVTLGRLATDLQNKDVGLIRENGPYGEPKEVWRNTSSEIHILKSSRNCGWRGAVFHEAQVKEPFGFSDYTLDTINIAMPLVAHKIRATVSRGVTIKKNAFVAVEHRPHIYLPGERICCEWQGSFAFTSLAISENLVENILHSRLSEMARSNIRSSQAQIEHLLNILLLDVSSNIVSGPALGETIITQIVHYLNPDDGHNEILERTGTAQRHIVRVQEFIEANLFAPLNLADLAGLVNLSTRHFCRAFRSFTGSSPYEYILRRRVERASQLIRQGDSSLAQVALSVGFSSHAHMTATFQRVLGVPPSHFGNTTKEGIQPT